MANKNLVILIGKISKMKNIKTTTGKPMVTFTITTYRKKDFMDDDISKPQRHPCVAYSGLAETLMKYVQDGREIMIEGELEYFYQEEAIKPQVCIKQLHLMGKDAA